MFFVIKRRHIAAILSGIAFLSIYAGILWGGHPSVPVSSSQTILPRQKTVVIDAGHGGADGGAVAGDGTPESRINLEVAQRLEGIFALLGVDTIMVRNKDVSVHTEGETLREQKVSDIHNRVDLVNCTGNAVLISIHQNSLPQVPSVHGAQVFYNAVVPAPELARTVQQVLNAAINYGNEKQEKAIHSSVYLMNHIQTAGILVECGFLSNPQETEALKSQVHQMKLAMSIAAGYMQHTTTEGEGGYP